MEASFTTITKLLFKNALCILLSSIGACILEGIILSFMPAYSRTQPAGGFVFVILFTVILGHAFAWRGLLAYLIVSTGLIINKKATLITFCISAFIIGIINYLVLLPSIKHDEELFRFSLPIAGLITAFIHWRLIKETISQQWPQSGKQTILSFRMKWAMVVLLTIGVVWLV